VMERHLHRRELGERVDQRAIAVGVGLLEHVPEIAVGLVVVDREEEGELAHWDGNLCTDGLFGNDDSKRREGVEWKPPRRHVPAARAEERRVLARIDEVGDNGAAARLDDAHDLGERSLAFGARVDVVQAQVGDDDVDAAVGECECARVLVADLAVGGDAFGGDVGDGGLERVARQIRLLEDVDADGAAAGQPLGSADGEEAAAGADVEHLLAIGAAKRLSDGKSIGIDIFQKSDLSGNALERTLENVALEGVGARCEIRHEDARTLAFADGSVDVVVSNLCLHNIHPRAERERALAEIARVLKPGGRAVISDFIATGQYRAFFRARGFSVTRRTFAVDTFPPLRIVVAEKSVGA
jgi:SAM-dependent methyltransferase